MYGIMFFKGTAVGKAGFEFDINFSLFLEEENLTTSLFYIDFIYVKSQRDIFQKIRNRLGDCNFVDSEGDAILFRMLFCSLFGDVNPNDFGVLIKSFSFLPHASDQSANWGLKLIDSLSPRLNRKTVAIIRQWDSYEFTDVCLSDFFSANSKVDVILVDDASKDDSLVKLKLAHPNIIIISFPYRREYVFCLKYAAALSAKLGAEYLFFCNNDVSYFDSRSSCGFLDNLREHLAENPSTGMVSPKSLSWDGSETPTRTVDKLGAPFTISTESYMIRVADWIKLGGFELNLVRYCEDMEFLRDLRSLGLEGTILTSSTFRHYGSGSSGRQVVIPTYFRVRNGVFVAKRNLGGLISARKAILRWLNPHLKMLGNDLRKFYLLKFSIRLISMVAGIFVGLAFKLPDNKKFDDVLDADIFKKSPLLEIDRVFEKSEIH